MGVVYLAPLARGLSLKMLARASVLSGGPPAGGLKLPPVVVGRIHHVLWDRGPQFLTGCQPEVPSDIRHMGLSIEKSHDGKWLPSGQANERPKEGK